MTKSQRDQLIIFTSRQILCNAIIFLNCDFCPKNNSDLKALLMVFLATMCSKISLEWIMFATFSGEVLPSASLDLLPTITLKYCLPNGVAMCLLLQAQKVGHCVMSNAFLKSFVCSLARHNFQLTPSLTNHFLSLLC